MQFIAIAVFLVIAAAYLLYQYRQRAFVREDDAPHAIAEPHDAGADELKAA